MGGLDEPDALILGIINIYYYYYCYYDDDDDRVLNATLPFYHHNYQSVTTYSVSLVTLYYVICSYSCPGCPGTRCFCSAAKRVHSRGSPHQHNDSDNVDVDVDNTLYKV
jgi:hypothetical protein